MASVSLREIYKKYAGGVIAVSDFNIEIKDKEFIILVGPSGCGKSTTLRMIAGLEEISEGELYIGDRLVNDIAPKDRDIAMVFQNYALYPHMTVFENMAFGLKLRKVPKDEIARKVEEAARILDIAHLLDRNTELEYMDKLEHFVRLRTRQVEDSNIQPYLRQFFDAAAVNYKDSSEKNSAKTTGRSTSAAGRSRTCRKPSASK